MKKLLVVLAVLTLFATLAMASETRLEGLGLNGGWWAPTSWMVTDANNVNLFPSTILKYPKLAVFEYDGDNLNSYVNLDLLGGVIGLYTSYDSWYNYNLSGSNSGVLYGRNLSDTMSVAVGVTYQQYLDKQVQNSTEVPVSNNKDIFVHQFSNTIGINLGLSLLSDIPMDFGLSLVLPLNITNEETNFDSDGNKTDYAQTKDAGLQAKLSSKANLGDMAVALGIQFYSEKYEEINQNLAPGDVITYNWYRLITTQYVEIQLGAVKTVKLDKTTVFAGTQFEMDFWNHSWADGFDKITQTKTDSTDYNEGLMMNIPLLIGAETKINDNWTLRAGAKKSMWNNYTFKNYTKNFDGKITSAGDTYTTSDTNDLSVNFGATFEVAAFSIDFLINKDLILNGPEFISGRGAYGDDTTPWASKIALNFKW